MRKPTHRRADLRTCDIRPYPIRIRAVLTLTASIVHCTTSTAPLSLPLTVPARTMPNNAMVGGTADVEVLIQPLLSDSTQPDPCFSPSAPAKPTVWAPARNNEGRSSSLGRGPIIFARPQSAWARATQPSQLTTWPHTHPLKAVSIGLINACVGIPALIGFAAIVYRHRSCTAYLPALCKFFCLASGLMELVACVRSTLPFAVVQVSSIGCLQQCPCVRRSVDWHHDAWPACCMCHACPRYHLCVYVCVCVCMCVCVCVCIHRSRT